MIALSLEDLLFEVRRKGRLLPPAACAQILEAALRAAESQGVAPLPAMFLLDPKDGLVLDVHAIEGGHSAVQAAAELGRSLLIGPSGALQGEAGPVVRRALQQGFQTLGAFRKALVEACPPLAADAQRRVFTALHELVSSWQSGVDSGALPEALQALAGARQPAAASAPPRPASAVTDPVRLPPAIAAPVRLPPVVTAPVRLPPVVTAPVRVPPAVSAPPPPPAAVVTAPPAGIEDRLAAIEGALGTSQQTMAPPARALRTPLTIAISALTGALVATAVIRLPAKPPPPPAPPAVVYKLIVHEPAPEPPHAAAEAPDAGVPAAQSAPADAGIAAPPPPPAAPEVARAAPTRSRPRPSRKPSASPAQAEVTKGDQALRKGQLDEAQAAFQSALSADSAFAPAMRGLAMVLMTQGREADAKAEYEKYLKAAPDAPDASRIRKVVANLGGQ